MVNEPHSTESTTEHRDETGPSHSRRGVLKAAATGVAGLAGVVAATGNASARDGGKLTVHAWNGGRWDYRADTTGHFTSGADGNDNVHSDYIVGTIYEGNRDTYTHTGSIYFISVIPHDGALSFSYRPSKNTIRVHAYGGGPPQWDYHISATGDIDLTSNCEPHGPANGEDDDLKTPNYSGDAVAGDLTNFYTDTYRYTGAIDYIRVNHSISFY